MKGGLKGGGKGRVKGRCGRRSEGTAGCPQGAAIRDARMVAARWHGSGSGRQRGRGISHGELVECRVCTPGHWQADCKKNLHR